MRFSFPLLLLSCADIAMASELRDLGEILDQEVIAPSAAPLGASCHWDLECVLGLLCIDQRCAEEGLTLDLGSGPARGSPADQRPLIDQRPPLPPVDAALNSCISAEPGCPVLCNCQGVCGDGDGLLRSCDAALIESEHPLPFCAQISGDADLNGLINAEEAQAHERR